MAITKQTQHVDESSSQPVMKRPVTPSAITERVRVLLVANSVAVGGMEEHIKLLSRHLDREQFEVFGICPDWEPTVAFTQALATEADHVATITPDDRYGRWKQLIETVRFFRQLRMWRIQVMHMHSTTYRGQIWMLVMARLAGIRHIYATEHLAPDAPLPFAERLVRNLFSRMVNGIVCVSEKNCQARSTYIYTPEKQTLVVNNGVDVNDFPSIPSQQIADLRSRYDLPNEAQIVGTVVRFEPEKGLNDLIAAFASIHATCPRAYLLMVGDGSLRGELETQAAELGLSNFVRFTGFQNDPRPFLSMIDAFVLPVPVGSMSIGLLEAMAMRCAVVITFGGKGEAVIHGESGFCAEPRNPDSIAHFVIQILQNPELQQSLGTSARQRVEEHFSAQRVAKVLGTLYAHGFDR